MGEDQSVPKRKGNEKRMGENVGTGFRHADRALFGKLLHCLDFMCDHPFFKQYKSQAWRRLEIWPGQRILDVGCGTGSDLIQLARLYPETDFIGVDQSENFLALARERAASTPNLKFLHADAHRLPFDDRSLDAARIDRSLQHMENPPRVLKEMARVIRTGGRMVATEPDWETFVLFNGAVEDSRKMAHYFQRSIRNPYTGRELASWMNDVAVTDLTTRVHAFWTHSLDDANVIFDLHQVKDQCIQADILTLEDAESWWRSAEEASRKRTFSAALNIVETSGVVST